MVPEQHCADDVHMPLGGVQLELAQTLLTQRPLLHSSLPVHETPLGPGVGWQVGGAPMEAPRQYSAVAQHSLKEAHERPLQVDAEPPPAGPPPTTGPVHCSGSQPQVPEDAVQAPSPEP